MKLLLLLLVQFSFTNIFSQPSDSSHISLTFLDKAWNLYKSHKFEECIPLLDSCISYDKTKTSALSLKYESLWFLKRFAESAKTFEESMISDTNILYIHAYVILGMLYDQAKMRNKAKEQYRKAIQIFESGYISPIKGDKSYEDEYLFAFGLIRERKLWKSKLNEYIKKHPFSHYEKFKKITRKKLLKYHFAPFAAT